MACHASDAASSVREMLEFDEVCRIAHEFAKKDGHTLVVVTADHATGGLAITEKVRDRVKLFERVKVSAEHLDQMIKQNPRAAAPEVVAREVIKEQTGVDDVTDDEIKAYFALKGPYDPPAMLGEIVSKRLGVTFIPLDYRLVKPNETHGHDGAMVPVYAAGAGAGQFNGTLENTDIPKRIRQIAGYR
jgi:alkaline phosphatase